MAEDSKQGTDESVQDLPSEALNIINRYSSEEQGQEVQTEEEKQKKEVKENENGQGQEVQPENEENADDDVLELDQPEADRLEELGYNLETDLVGKSFEEVKNILLNDIKNEKSETAEQGQEQSNIVTKEMVQNLGFLKSTEGMTIDEALRKADEAINNQNSFITKLQNEKSENSKSTVKTENDEDFSIDDDVDILTLEPEEQREYFKKRDQKVANAVAKQIMEQLSPLLQPMQKQQTANAEKDFFDRMQNNLPEGIDAKTALDAWKKANPLTAEEAQFYQTYPSQLINAVSNYARNMKPAKKAEDSKKKKETSEGKKITVVKIRQSIKDANKSTEGKTYNAVERNQKPSWTNDADLDDDVNAILERNKN